MEHMDRAELELFFANEALTPGDLLQRLSTAASKLFPTPEFHAQLVKVRSNFPPPPSTNN
jgi:hypothetical protein